LNANMNVAGTLTNYAAATLNVEGPGSYTTTGRLVNYGFINEILGGNLSTPILVNAGFIQTDQYSRIQVGTGKTGDPGYFQFSDGTLVEAIGADYFGVTAVNGGASINGTLSIFLKNGFVPELGAVYRFLYFTPGELSGEFSSIGNQYFNNGLEMWEITYDNRRGFVQLTAGPSPEPGSVLLLGGGLLAAASTVRRRLR
jgi:hypothetical protein